MEYVLRSRLPRVAIVSFLVSSAAAAGIAGEPAGGGRASIGGAPAAGAGIEVTPRGTVLTDAGGREIYIPGIRATPKFVATFESGPIRTATGDGTSDDGVWWVEQKAGTNRATVVNGGRDGARALRLHTEPGDTDVSGSGAHERNDVALPQKTTDCSEGREQVWEHSILFPDDFVQPTGGWYAVAGFHHTGATGQGNFSVFVQQSSFRLVGHGGVFGSARKFDVDGGAVTRNQWYDFVYHVRWSSGSDGFFDGWVNGVKRLSYRGPTLYAGQGCYLKLANYHTAFGQPTSVIHDRVIRYDVVRE